MRELVTGVVPWDEVEAEHRSATLHWLSGTDDVFRRVKPATPPRHLVSYVVPVDPADGSVLLVDHVNAGLWLPPGGHVDPDEHPADTARREAWEELGVPVGAGLVGEEPVFVTVTRTVGIDAGHTDVSLWFVLRLDRQHPLTPDSGEFREARWWSPAELRDADPARFDPHFIRFCAKLQRMHC
ncbi:NUDIX hydrolase [Plantactinospora sp. BB1]|nr:NUDIX hydrolase [Plantactinospora sp. BB1]